MASKTARKDALLAAVRHLKIAARAVIAGSGGAAAMNRIMETISLLESKIAALK